ncbi:50S ribosomal protein L9, partial [Aeromicrobium sp.]|uniref:50S ribosomal protein L9 n=1 Tax=Aeromicrobium sp. TaxID=1871063 RepID=UPI002FCC7F95
MKLILTHEVTNLGAPGDIVDVKDGYGRNFLLPRNFAIRWTKGGAKQVESIKAARDTHAIHDLEEAQSIKGNLEANPINVPVRAGTGGRLFGAVTVS